MPSMPTQSLAEMRIDAGIHDLGVRERPAHRKGCGCVDLDPPEIEGERVLADRKQRRRIRLVGRQLPGIDRPELSPTAPRTPEAEKQSTRP